MKIVVPSRYEVRRAPHEVYGNEKMFGVYDTFLQQFDLLNIRQTPLEAERIARNMNHTYEQSLA
jgi:hypothetical protein